MSSKDNIWKIPGKNLFFRKYEWIYKEKLKKLVIVPGSVWYLLEDEYTMRPLTQSKFIIEDWVYDEKIQLEKFDATNLIFDNT
jgi:hypothetical protein